MKEFKNKPNVPISKLSIMSTLIYDLFWGVQNYIYIIFVQTCRQYDKREIEPSKNWIELD